MITNTQQRIMLINIDPNFVPITTTALEQHDYQVINTFFLSDTLWHMERFGFPNLAIVDVDATRNMDGLTICAKLREVSDFPLLSLTCANNLDASIAAARSQIDDFIRKPVITDELIARTQWLLQRNAKNPQNPTQSGEICGELKVNFILRQVTNGKSTLLLSPQESKILYILNQNAGHIVNTNLLCDRIWPNDPENEGRIRTGVARLRRKLSGQFGCTSLIITEHGQGYRLDNKCQKCQCATLNTITPTLTVRNTPTARNIHTLNS